MGRGTRSRSDRALASMPRSPYAPAPSATGGKHAQVPKPRQAPLLSSGPANAVRASRARRRSSAGSALSRAAQSSCSKSSAATIPARAARENGFKRCCLASGRFRRRGAAGLLAVTGFLPCATPKEREGSAKPEGKKVSHEDTTATKMERPARPAARHLRGLRVNHQPPAERASRAVLRLLPRGRSSMLVSPPHASHWA
jgi:hypothetical protein